ncbi:MAG: DUF2075 domain-containing protein [Bacilli bacterium]|nr:DUF2075 domain-containing protein [Bacilli bacterium]
MAEIFETVIEQFKFTGGGAEKVRRLSKGENWPVVYILNGSKYAYVGETNNAYRRIGQHLKNEKRNSMKRVSIILGDKFNKSATLDIENKLIQHMHADRVFVLQNENAGQSVKNNYYQKEVYEQTFQEIWKKLIELGLAKHNLYAIRNSEIFKYSPYKELTEEQFECVELLLRLTGRSLSNNNKEKLIVEGGAGTGKTVLAIYFIKCLVDLINKNTNFEDLDTVLPEGSEILESIELVKTIQEHKDIKIGYVIPTPSFKKTVQRIFKLTPGLSPKMVISPVDIWKEKYDIIIVDEAHRLKNYEGTQQHGFHKQANKALGIDEKASELSMVMAESRPLTVLFYDPLQTIRKSDVDPEEFAELINDNSIYKHQLTSQLRLKGGNDYVKFIKSLFSNKPITYTPEKYVFEPVNNPEELMNIIKQKNAETRGLCRVLAGFAYKFNNNVRKKRITKTGSDVDVNGDGKYVYDWNPKYNDSSAVIDDKNIEKIVSVFACQGYDLNYAGVILGPDIYYDKKTRSIEVDLNYVKDKKMKIKGDYEATKRNVLNQYLVLLTRGIEGTYFYAVDKNLREFIESLLVVKKEDIN